MNTIRMITMVLPMMLLLACGGGSSSGGATATPTTPTAPTTPTTPPNPLTQFSPTVNSSTLEDVQAIGDANGVVFLFTDLAEIGKSRGDEPYEAQGRSVILPGGAFPMKFNIQDIGDLSLIVNDSYFDSSSYDSMITNSVTFDDATFARSRLTGTRAADSSPLEFQTFSGWFDGSIFGTTQITIGASGSEQYRFISHTVGVRSGSNPAAAGSETSATWEGAAVATIKADRTFIRGDATIDIDNLASPDVDVMLDNWLGIDGQAVSGVDAINYTDLLPEAGGFRGQGEHIRGFFYGTGHEEVGGFFDTETVTGAFGATRQ